MIKRFLSNNLVKLTNWEYWPFELVYLPIFAYYIILSIRARSFLFFSAANPGIETGGMLGESKFKILDKIPEEYRAKTVFIQTSDTLEDVILKIHSCNIHFPIIVKPDIGERGNGVEKIENKIQLEEYHKKYRCDFLIQEYLELPIELGIFYFRLPENSQGTITSIVQKEFLHVVGDGRNNIGTLMQKTYRASKQFKRLQCTIDYNFIPIMGERVILEPIGNHCRGTKFLDVTQIIDDSLISSIHKISSSIPGFYYGRFDLKCNTIEDLKNGKDIKIMELNGAGAEPAHIYQPGYSLLKAWKVLLNHISTLYKISRANHSKGIPYMKYREAKHYYQRNRDMKKMFKK